MHAFRDIICMFIYWIVCDDDGWLVIPFTLLFRYGGGPPVARRVINTGSVQDDRLAVEVYPLRIRLTVTPNEMELIVRLSKQVIH